MSNESLSWDINHLHVHLQDAVDLEFWTIPYYMSAMYSIIDPSHVTYRLIQSVVYQEMLHTQLAANVANAYGLSPCFAAPQYPADNSSGIPHLKFSIDTPDPTEIFTPHSGAIGPLDLTRINTMCLIEYPEWYTGHQPNVQEDTSQYGSIGEFYDALTVGAVELTAYLEGNRNQVNFFQRFYQNFAQPTVTDSGVAGRDQVLTLIKAITEQGEGKTQGNLDIQQAFQNTADGYYPSWSHYRKFIYIRDSMDLPATYRGDADPPPGSDGETAQSILIENFAIFREKLEALFRGEAGEPADFGPIMDTVGGNILNCWQNGAIPKFS